MEVVKELEVVEVPTAVFPRRRVVVLRRNDGRYTFAEQYFFISEYEGTIVEQGWATLDFAGIYATAVIAEREARAAFPDRYHSTD